MKLTRQCIAFPASLLLGCGLIGASPATRPAAADPLAALAQSVAQKSAGQSVVLVLRPDSSSTLETPTAIAAIADAVTTAMRAANVNLVQPDTASTLLRDKALAGQPAVPAVASLLAAAKADLLLCGGVHRLDDSHKISFALMGPRGTITQMSVTVPGKSLAAAGTDSDLATAAIAGALKPATAKCIDPAAAAGVKTVLLGVVAQTTGEGGTAGFEKALFDSVSEELHQNQIEVQPLIGMALPSVLQPSWVAKLKDPPADSAFLLLSYARRPGGTLVTLWAVSSKARLATASAGIDTWDVAAMPAIPLLNLRGAGLQ